MEIINEPHSNDVLLGRGNSINNHPGNEEFRKRVNNYKIDYVSCPKSEKGKFAVIILKEIRSLDPPGRFLKLSGDEKRWIEVDEKKVIDKIRQALREGAPDILKVITGEDKLDRLPTTTHELRSKTPPPPSSVPSMSNVDGMDPPGRLDQEGSSLDSNDAEIILNMLQSVDTSTRSENDDDDNDGIRKAFSVLTKQPQLPVLKRPKLVQDGICDKILDLRPRMERGLSSLTISSFSMNSSSESESSRVISSVS